jgi:hypothetical protein
MTVTPYEDDNGGGYEGTFFSAGVYDLSEHDYNMGYFSDWNDEVSSLYSAGDITVFEDAGYSGDSATLPAGFHDLDSLEAYGIDNDSISSFHFNYSA